MHKLMLNMRRQTLIHLLLSWLLLAAPRRHYSTITGVQAIESVYFNLKPAQPNTRSATRFVWPTWVSKRVDGKRIHKNPSGPNPVGNHRPPSRQ